MIISPLSYKEKQVNPQTNTTDPQKKKYNNNT